MEQKRGTRRRRRPSLAIALSLLAAMAVSLSAATAADLPALLEKAKESKDIAAYARAEAAARDALKADPKNVAAMVVLGSAELEQHRYQEAVQAADQALALKPDALDALGLHADASLQLGQLIQARADTEKLLAAKPDLLAHLRMGELQFAEGDAQAAIGSFESAVEAGETDKASPALQVRALVRLGEAHFRAGEWDAAEHAYQSALKLRGDDADVHDHIAELYAARGEFEQAISHSDRAIAKCSRPEFLQSRGDIHAAMNDPDEAARWHGKALTAYVADAEAGRSTYLARVARMHCDVASMRDPAEALRWARRAAQFARNVDTFDALAWAFYQSEKYKDAADAMDKALRQRTADADVLYHAGLIYSRAGDARKGATYLRRASLANPKFNEFHFRR